MSIDNSAAQRAIETFREGGFVLVVEPRGAVGPWVDSQESRGALVCPAATCDDQGVNYLATHGRGLVCVGLTEPQCARLGLSLQGPSQSTMAFTTSVEASTGVTTGISAADRARTIEVCIDPTASPSAVVSPGHVFPVQTHAGGVLGVRGPAEASVDLARLAELEHPAGVFCQVLSESGDEANGPELAALSKALGTPVVTYDQLVRYRMGREWIVRAVESGQVPTANGEFETTVWENMLDGTNHLLLQLGPTGPIDGQAPLVRVHSQCLTGDVFGSQRCDCGAQLEAALAQVSEAGQGAVLYLRQEGRGIGLLAKLQAYALQDRGRDTVEANEELGFEADQREYGIGAQILHQAGYREVRLLTNNPRKISGLESFGVRVAERVPLEIAPVAASLRYLRAKKDKLGHLLDRI